MFAVRPESVSLHEERELRENPQAKIAVKIMPTSASAPAWLNQEFYIRTDICKQIIWKAKCQDLPENSHRSGSFL